MTIKSTSQEFFDYYFLVIEELKQKGQEHLNKVFNIFWNDNPEVKVIIWEQYAPGYNDGEPCIFGVKDLSFSNLIDETEYSNIRFGEYDGDNEDVWVLDTYFNKKEQKFNMEQAKELENFLQSSRMTKVMELIFGDSARITATRQGFTVENCEPPY
jgi:hypothetical protein